MMAAKNKGRILVVDDNAGIRGALKILLPMHFAQVELISTPNDLINKVQEFKPNAVLLDMNFHTDINTGNEGLYWLAELKKCFPAIEILSNAVQKQQKETRINPQQESILPDKMLWGTTPQMQQIRRSVEKIAPTDATVLITGENGTGKDVLAGEIYRLGSRVGRPMVSVDVGALTETLFESELFGHVKGAFTDAHTDHVGKFEQANGGTLFLDEIGNIPLHLQGKLLRVLQNRCITRVGDTRQIPIDIRLICATNMDLEQMIRDGRFREDLYYRINTMQIKLPPLRERTDEIKGLALNFLERYAQKYHRSVAKIDSQALAALKLHRWNGNIRELKNSIEKAGIMSEGDTLTLQDLQFSIQVPDGLAAAQGISGGGAAIAGAPAGGGAGVQAGGGGAGVLPGGTAGASQYNGETLEMQEERTIRAAVEKCGGNLSLVAKTLNISRPTLYSKLKKYGI